ncbi:MAG: hypothetical protein FWF87_04300 [Synergistaceae bacterium]|nr:hypothetical protein [Synergistaceae bacterium]
MISVHMKSSLIENEQEKKTEFHEHKKKTEPRQTQRKTNWHLILLLISAVAVITFDIAIYMQKGLEGLTLKLLLIIVCIVFSCYFMRFFVDIYIERKLSIKEEEAIKQIVKRMYAEDRRTKSSNIKEQDRLKHNMRISSHYSDRDKIKHHARNSLVGIFHKQGS